MGGTTEGGKKASATNKEKYGENYYQKIALKSQEKWIKNGRKPRGFSKDRELAVSAGRIGGTISKRTKAK